MCGALVSGSLIKSAVATSARRFFVGVLLMLRHAWTWLIGSTAGYDKKHLYSAGNMADTDNMTNPTDYDQAHNYGLSEPRIRATEHG